jgi:hypothetical protein
MGPCFLGHRPDVHIDHPSVGPGGFECFALAASV